MPTRAKNHFQLFSLPETFELNQEALDSAWRNLQDTVHPDRYAGADEDQRLLAVQQASLLNQAHETLKHPLQRAAYLLELRGEDIHAFSQSDLSADLLLEQMELRETLENIPQDDSGLDQLASMHARIAGQIKDSENQFGRQLGGGDLYAARRCFRAMQYQHKLLAEIEASQENLLGY